MPFGAIVSAPLVLTAAPAETQGAKNYRNLLASLGLAAQLEGWGGRQTGQDCEGKVCRMELENWVQTSHSKPGSGHRVASNSGEGGHWTGGRGRSNQTLGVFSGRCKRFQEAVNVSSCISTHFHVEASYVASYVNEAGCPTFALTPHYLVHVEGQGLV